MNRKELTGVGNSIVTAVLLLLVSSTSVSADYTIDWWTIDGGGVSTSSAGRFTLSGTIGQHDAAETITARHLELDGGFWFKLVPGDCNSDGGVDLIDYRDLEECLFGPGASYHDSSCICFDFDEDDDVDLLDFAEFQVYMVH